jgi:hypothetical protein
MPAPAPAAALRLPKELPHDAIAVAVLLYAVLNDCLHIDAQQQLHVAYGIKRLTHKLGAALAAEAQAAAATELGAAGSSMGGGGVGATTNEELAWLAGVRAKFSFLRIAVAARNHAAILQGLCELLGVDVTVL